MVDSAMLGIVKKFYGYGEQAADEFAKGSGKKANEV
jgi:hypothetical protein